MYISKLIGFDAREMWLDSSSQWSRDLVYLGREKDTLLLKPEILKALSVDSYIWYTVFSELLEPRLWNAIERREEYSGSEWDDVFSNSPKLSSPDVYSRGRTWRNLASMRDYLQQSWGNTWKPCYLIAVAEIMRSTELDEEDNESGLEPILPATIDSEWVLLGYDVADYDLYTGLFNGKLPVDEMAKLRHEWREFLNEHHLFIEPDKAFDYIDVATMRYPSHAPYYVYALYGVEPTY